MGIFNLIRTRLLRIADSRPPDVVIGGEATPYTRRWWVIPRNRWFNVYLHHFLQSDDDRALHDHPWWNASLLLSGSYREHVPADPGDPSGPTKATLREQGAFVFRRSGNTITPASRVAGERRHRHGLAHAGPAGHQPELAALKPPAGGAIEVGDIGAPKGHESQIMRTPSRNII